MALRQKLDLTAFDGRLMDGLTFCKKVYSMFDQVRSGLAGASKLRMRPTKEEKRLVEELVPISHYIQTKYSVDWRIKVRWVAGSQTYDATMLSSGPLVDKGLIARNRFVEVTRAVHPNEYLVRELIDRSGCSFGVRGVTRDQKTKVIKSVPHVRHEGEIQSDLAESILESLSRKSDKSYPEGTVLIIDCVPNSVVLEEEWNSAIRKARATLVKHRFAEVFVSCSHLRHSTSL
jgi:hypothetical protein